MNLSNKPSTERAVAKLLRSQLAQDDVLLEGVRFSDPQFGDVEVDLMLFMPGYGIATIEVKGGEVSYVAGEWRLSSGNYTRRIKPIEQARKAKHALRRYLDRQPGWEHGLIRAEWFVVMPYTEVTQDFGPEGRRELLIGRNDLGEMVSRIKAEMSRNPDDGHVPDAACTALALGLVQGSDASGFALTRERSADLSIAAVIGTVAVAMLVSGYESEVSSIGNYAILIGLGFSALLSVFIDSRFSLATFAARRRVAIPLVAVAATAIGIAASDYGWFN